MPRLSVATRAGLAVALMLGFYVLALGIAGGLLWTVYAQWAYLDRVYVKLSLLAVAGAGLILWAILPRIDRFEAPGPKLGRKEHPRLFAELERVAAAAGQTIPSETYLVSDLNAWVAQRGGVMGFGSRRVMGLGLPLLQTLSISELRAVVAHEYGHYAGGDTKLGPWVYKTRAAIERTLQHLAEHNELLMLPFLWYGKAFLRITHAVSRGQEFAADALAARIAGRDAMMRALRKIHGAGDAFGAYWQSEVVPAIERGFRPPLASGFQQFVRVPAIATLVESRLERELAEGKADPYDTHPALRERLAALEALPPAKEPRNDDTPAIVLLGATEALEREVVDSLLREDIRGKLAPLVWEEAGEKLWLPLWREQVAPHAEALRAITPAALPSLARDPVRAGMTLGGALDASAVGDVELGRAQHLIGAALSIALHERGFAISALPGEAVSLSRGALVIRPFTVLGDLASERLGAADWQATCAEAGIAGIALGSQPVTLPEGQGLAGESNGIAEYLHGE